MKIGSENKKAVYALSILGVIAAYMVYSQFFSGPSYAPARVPAPTASGPGNPEPDVSQAREKVGKTGSRSKNGEFRPIYQPKKKEQRPDPGKIDPSLRLDLLAKVMKVPAAGGERDLFTMSKAPPKPVETASLKGPETIVH